jgi:glycosyltransferase involved in cell wall biosynthesis
MVRESMPVVYMPPSTDPLDGLNKPIPEEFLETYRHQFNNLSRSSTGQELDWKRGYIIQVARFDPSKGIPDLVEGYRLFRKDICKEDKDKASTAPQLIMVCITFDALLVIMLSVSADWTYQR